MSEYVLLELPDDIPEESVVPGTAYCLKASERVLSILQNSDEGIGH